MGELNQLAEALDHELSSISLGRRASDKRKQRELISLVQELEKAGNGKLADARLDSEDVSQTTYSRDDVARATDLFFDLLMTEENSSVPLRLLLGFLQRSVAQSVQKSPSFFIDPKHPARRLIKALFVRESDIKDKENFQADRVYLALHASIKAVVRDYRGDDRLFIRSYYEILRA